MEITLKASCGRPPGTQCIRDKQCKSKGRMPWNKDEPEILHEAVYLDAGTVIYDHETPNKRYAFHICPYLLLEAE